MRSRTLSTACAGWTIGLAISACIAGALEPPIYEVPGISSPVRVDGRLDDPAWQDAVVIEARYETHPGENTPARVSTQCLLMHDRNHLYVAFRAFDAEPERIQAHLADRDDAWDDDVVGVVLDTFNDQRRAFEFFVNPLGVQMDLIRDDVNRREDETWDAIWESSGRITDLGYIVELAIPFAQLRFSRSDGVRTWGIDVIRVQPRDTEYINRSQPRDFNRDCELCQLSKLRGFVGATPGRNVELDPTLTAVSLDEREQPDQPLVSMSDDVELGLTARWGLRPDLQLLATVNPDFSQVEADAAQLEVNERFALFFPEKRPFFLEGADRFDSPVNVVHTRTVVDPPWGVKAIGKQGRNTIGIFGVEDQVTTLLIPGPEDSEREVFDARNRSGVFRYLRDIGRGSSLGVLVTGRDGQGYSNLVYGIDGALRVSASDTLQFQMLGSETRYPDQVREEFDQPDGTLTDAAATASYLHETRHWSWEAHLSSFGGEFRADSGFVPQVGFRQVSGELWRVWWGRDTWFVRTRVGGNVEYIEDEEGELLERKIEVGWLYEGPLRSVIDLRIERQDQASRGVLFADQTGARVRSRVFLRGDLELGLNARIGDRVDFEHNRPGDELQMESYLSWRPGLHWRINFVHELRRLDVAEGRLFSANLSQLNLRYQFDVRAFVRAIVQYSDIQRDPLLYEKDRGAEEQELFSQLLFSYTVNPRTVLFVGYSDAWSGDDEAGLTQDRRTVFLKVGYAWLF